MGAELWGTDNTGVVPFTVLPHLFSGRPQCHHYLPDNCVLNPLIKFRSLQWDCFCYESLWKMLCALRSPCRRQEMTLFVHAKPSVDTKFLPSLSPPTFMLRLPFHSWQPTETWPLPFLTLPVLNPKTPTVKAIVSNYYIWRRWQIHPFIYPFFYTVYPTPETGCL